MARVLRAGSVEVLISHPMSMTHNSMTSALRKRIGVTGASARISFKLEEAAEVIEDVEQVPSG